MTTMTMTIDRRLRAFPPRHIPSDFISRRPVFFKIVCGIDLGDGISGTGVSQKGIFSHRWRGWINIINSEYQWHLHRNWGVDFTAHQLDRNPLAFHLKQHGAEATWDLVGAEAARFVFDATAQDGNQAVVVVGAIRAALEAAARRLRLVGVLRGERRLPRLEGAAIISWNGTHLGSLPPRSRLISSAVQRVSRPDRTLCHLYTRLNSKET